MMQYPLEEKIGIPELLVGRKQEFASFGRWLDGIATKRSKSRVILARRKSGKTSFVQRIFNNLWNQNGTVIPFYFDIADKNVWYPNFAIEYYRTFASHYISFLERDPALVRYLLSLDEIHAYGKEAGNRYLVRDVESLWRDREQQYYDSMWFTASAAPHRHASVSGLDGGKEVRFLVILDELQNIANHVYLTKDFSGEPDSTMPGSFHSLSESKVAPMLVTGSYPGILEEIMAEHLEAGRLTIFRMKPYLQPKEGLKAVERYADVYHKEIRDETADQINKLCKSDPFLISCVLLSDFDGKDLMTEDGVLDAVNFELTDFDSEMTKTWKEYLRRTFERVNGINTKKLILHLNQYTEKDWTPQELQKELNLDLSTEEIYERLEILVGTDVIAQGKAAFRFRGLDDSTLTLILRNHFEEEIEGTVPDFKAEFQAELDAARDEADEWRGRANQYKGELAERNLANEFRKKHQVRLSDYFKGVTDTRLFTMKRIQERFPFQRLTGKNEEVDLFVTTEEGVFLMIEVCDQEKSVGIGAVRDLHTNACDYAEQYDVTVLPAYLSFSGFTKKAKQFCHEHGIGLAEEIKKK